MCPAVRIVPAPACYVSLAVRLIKGWLQVSGIVAIPACSVFNSNACSANWMTAVADQAQAKELSHCLWLQGNECIVLCRAAVQVDPRPTVELQGPVCFMNVAFVLHALQQQLVRRTLAYMPTPVCILSTNSLCFEA